MGGFTNKRNQLAIALWIKIIVLTSRHLLNQDMKHFYWISDKNSYVLMV